MNKKLGLLGGLAAMTGAASATTTVLVEYTGSAAVSNAPVAGVFHDGSFNSFMTGSTASAGIETLAEVGNPMPYLSSAPAGSNTGTNGAPFASGTTASFVVTVDDTNTSFSFASMILASNDWFIGNSTPVDVSGILGAGLGTTMSFDALRVYDAGTESEDFAFSAGNPFIGVPGGDAANGDTLTNPITAVTDPDPYSLFANAPGGFDSTAYDFTGGSLGSFTLTVIPEPSSALLGMLGFIPFLRRRR